MPKDLTNSIIERKNILNNNMAIKAIYDNVGFNGVLFEGKYRFTKNQISQFFDVDTRTIDRLLENNTKELQDNGYEVFKGTQLKNFKMVLGQFILDSKNNIDSLNQVLKKINKASILGVFTFKALLNIGMLLKNSIKAQMLRGYIINFVVNSLNKKLVGESINTQNDYLKRPNSLYKLSYSEDFHNAIKKYVDEGDINYNQINNRIFLSIFNENAGKYKQMLNLIEKNQEHYSDVINLIAFYNNGFAKHLFEEYVSKGRKLKIIEVHDSFSRFEKSINSFSEPLKEKANLVMAYHGDSFKDFVNKNIRNRVREAESYNDFNIYLNNQVDVLEQRLEENKDVFKRLKER